MIGVTPHTGQRTTESTRRTWDGTRDAERLPHEALGNWRAVCRESGTHGSERGGWTKDWPVIPPVTKRAGLRKKTAPRQPPTLPELERMICFLLIRDLFSLYAARLLVQIVAHPVGRANYTQASIQSVGMGSTGKKNATCWRLTSPGTPVILGGVGRILEGPSLGENRFLTA